MPEGSALRPARRFLHVCYCCDDTDAVVGFVQDGLDLRLKMQTPMERSSGAIFGMEGEIESSASFVFDDRGPRQCPAIEIQSWVDPPLAGTPVTDPTSAGIQALGYAVRDLDTAVPALGGLGCTVIGQGSAPFGGPSVTIRDPTGVTFDLVADASVPAGSARMRHVRITTSDLAASVPWYEGLGFEEVGRGPFADGSWTGLDAEVRGVSARLRLPDEPTEVVLVSWDDPPTHGRHPADAFHAGLYRLAVGVDDTRGAYDAMAARGWDFDRAPMLVELHGTPVPDMWICFLSDPDGVPFEFVQRPRSAFAPGRPS